MNSSVRFKPFPSFSAQCCSWCRFGHGVAWMCSLSNGTYCSWSISWGVLGVLYGCVCCYFQAVGGVFDADCDHKAVGLRIEFPGCFHYHTKWMGVDAVTLLMFFTWMGFSSGGVRNVKGRNWGRWWGLDILLNFWRGLWREVPSRSLWPPSVGNRPVLLRRDRVDVTAE